MWVKRLPINYSDMSSYCYNNVFLWQSGKVFVMDNHMAALWCWLQTCDSKKSYNFMHVDRHYDLQDYFYDGHLAPLKQNSDISFKEYTSIKRGDEDFPLLRWDNYIMAGYCLHPRWFHTNLCITHKEGSFKPGWGHDSLQIFEGNPSYLECHIQNYIIKPDKCFEGFNGCDYRLPWIVNLDLDVFYTSNSHIQLFSDDYIRRVAQLLNKGLKRIAVLTIALSPECLGGENLKEKWENGFRILKIMSEEMECLTLFFNDVQDITILK